MLRVEELLIGGRGGDVPDLTIDEVYSKNINNEYDIVEYVRKQLQDKSIYNKIMSFENCYISSEQRWRPLDTNLKSGRLNVVSGYATATLDRSQ
jgi:hypothetical protein